MVFHVNGHILVRTFTCSYQKHWCLEMFCRCQENVNKTYFGSVNSENEGFDIMEIKIQLQTSLCKW